MTAVFVNGNPESAAVWSPLLEALDRVDVVRLSPPGFGAPVPDGFGATADEYLAWLVSQVEAIGEPVDLVGHDWGANHVLRLACARPDLVRSWCTDTAGTFAHDYVWHEGTKAWRTRGDGEQAVAFARHGHTGAGIALRVAGHDPDRGRAVGRGLRRGDGSVHPGPVPIRRSGRAGAMERSASGCVERGRASCCSPAKTTTRAVSPGIAGSPSRPAPGLSHSKASATGGCSRTRHPAPTPCALSGTPSDRVERTGRCHAGAVPVRSGPRRLRSSRELELDDDRCGGRSCGHHGGGRSRGCHGGGRRGRRRRKRRG